MWDASRTSLRPAEQPSFLGVGCVIGGYDRTAFAHAPLPNEPPYARDCFLRLAFEGLGVLAQQNASALYVSSKEIKNFHIAGSNPPLGETDYGMLGKI